MSSWQVSGAISIFSALLGAVAAAALSKDPPAAQQTVNILGANGQVVAVEPSVAANEYRKLYRQYIELSEDYESQKNKLTTLAQENTALRSVQAKNSTDANAKVVIPLSNDYQEQYAGDYLFVLKGCEARGEQLSCALTVENQKGSGKLRLAGTSTIGGPSKAIDSDGNEYLPQKVTLGSSWNSSWVINQLSKNIPLKIEMSFIGVPSTVDKLAVLDLATGAGRVLFRDVSVD